MVAVLVILPLWLVVSAGLGLWKYYLGTQQEELIESSKFATPMTGEGLADDMRKLVGIVGPRNVGVESGRRGLRRASSMIQGLLGPSNAGYAVELEMGPEVAGEKWPIIVATLPGKEEQAVWVVAGYDTLGAGVEANSSGVCSLLAVARAVANERPMKSIKFAFLPHAYDPGSPVLPLLDQFTSLLGNADLLLVVEAMGAKGELLISSREVEVLRNPGFEKWGTIVGAEAICLEDDFDLTSTLFELNQPAVRIATRRVVSETETDEELPDPAKHLASTRALAELVMELAN
ncbi:M28 family peptidase [Haloferula sp.]|uniref:M28 family peptidase n=1 Tax=Haloferula sp. TaxID=2497595 RepID=UPI003C75906F